MEENNKSVDIVNKSDYVQQYKEAERRIMNNGAFELGKIIHKATTEGGFGLREFAKEINKNIGNCSAMAKYYRTISERYEDSQQIPFKEWRAITYKKKPKKEQSVLTVKTNASTEQGQHPGNKVIDVTPNNQQPNRDDLAGFTSAAEYEPPLPCQSCQEKDKEIEELKHLVNTKIKEKNKVIRAYKALEAKINQSSNKPSNNGDVFDLDEPERHFITEFNQADDQKKDKLRLMAIEQFGEDRVEELINIIKKPSS